MPVNFKKYLFLSLLLIFALSFFIRGNLRSVEEVMPETGNDPIQAQVLEPAEITFIQDGYEYNLTPVYEYELNGLVVSKMDYRFFSIHQYDQVFPVDLCMIWGSNAVNKVHRDRSVHFSQDCRYCWARWGRNAKFNARELSNSHLLVKDRRILKRLKNIFRGDQVRIKGKLVNVKSRQVDNPGPEFNWKTSTNRSDMGGGACEVIYVEDLRVLKEAHPLAKVLFRLSAYGIIIMVLWSIYGFFTPARKAGIKEP